VNLLLKDLVHDYLLLFAMVNAIGNLPLFADLTAGMERRTRRRTFRVAVAVAAGLVLGFAFLGNWMLTEVFELTTGEFQIAAGILVFIVAARGTILGPRSMVAFTEPASGGIAVFPMGFPLLAGPGTILTTILLMRQVGPIRAAVAALLVYLTVLPMMQLSRWVERAFSRVGVLVVSRVLYIFICAKAVAFVIEGGRALLVHRP